MQDINDNPFDVAEEEDDLENIKDSLVTSKSDTDLPRDSDWMYQTRMENRIYWLRRDINLALPIILTVVSI